jgi:uncharacterized protein YndB with AHSA1/START domain
MNIQSPGSHHRFTLTHEFNAPKKTVFNAFSTAEALNEWWGPAETDNSVITLDFRSGGIFHYKMESEGKTGYARFLFGNIQPYDLLEFSVAFTDEHANVIPAPFDMKLPLEIFYRLDFSETDGKTTLTLTGWPLNATSEEETTFRSIGDSMQQGFGATFGNLDKYLEKARK